MVERIWLSVGSLLVALVVGGSLWLGIASAGSTTTALYSMTGTFTNAGSSDLDDQVAAINLSCGALVSGGFINSDGLNAHLHRGATDMPSMPCTGRISVEGAVTQVGSTFTDITTAAQNTTLNDVPLLPASPAQNDAIYFGCDNPCRIVNWDVDTTGVGTWTLTYEYWDGNSYTGFSNTDDQTDGFTRLGLNTVSWDVPSDWATNTVTGSGTSSYWGRARVSAFTSLTTQPLGSRVRYENGQWWTWVEDLDVGYQEQYTLYFGGGTDMETSHQVFPGATGIITGDAATLETSGSYAASGQFRLNFASAASDACILCKTGVITVNVSGSAVAPAIGTSITGPTGTSTGDISGITNPDTGELSVIVAADGVNAATWVDGGGGMTSYPVRGLTDNGNNWTWASNGGVDYIESIRLDADAPAVFQFQTAYGDFNSGTQTSTQPYTGRLGLDNN